MNSVFEFILWPNCKGNCSFCWQKQQVKEGKQQMLSHEQKLQSIEKVYQYLSHKLKTDSHVLLVGGELFDDPSIDTNLSSLLIYAVGLMLTGKINLLYINTNLMYKIREESSLISFLTAVQEFDLFDRVRFTTSYDPVGRFNEASKKLMLSNLSSLVKRFEGLCPVVNVIMSRQVCDALIEKPATLTEFENLYKCHIHLLPYLELDKNLTVTSRLPIIQTLQAIESVKSGFINDYLMRMNLNQEKYLFLFLNNELVNVTAPKSECGHSVNFKLYNKSRTCFICDMNTVFGE